MTNIEQRRVAIIGGCRTPFVKAGTAFRDYTMQQLGTHVVKGLVERFALDPLAIDKLVFSTVLLDPRTPNWAREIVFAAGLPKTLYAHSVSNNCISGLVAIADIAEGIMLGRISCGIAGGSESMSNPPLLVHPTGGKLFLELSRCKTLGQRLGVISRFRPAHLLPNPPGVTEPSTGLTMGEHMEITAKQLGISREAQDEVAFHSHQNAAKAQLEGLSKSSILSLGSVSTDLLIRGDTSIEKLRTLKTVFDRSPSGTLTAGNSSPLTDGASAVLLMSEDAPAAIGREVLAYIKDYEFSAIDPNDGLLMAPAIAVPRLLERHGLRLGDFDLIEIHEAFGAQVVANIKAWEQGWKLGPIGTVDPAKVNTMGGSIALGHPFAATGGRIVTSLAQELARKGLKRGLISICAAGGMAGAMILER